MLLVENYSQKELTAKNFIDFRKIFDKYYQEKLD